ncbi:MAG TPA: RES family NAD+ phosphorylase [Terriglobales bacterium]|nr:RES family NAD+ phosphorylase [Terriglobales bacterium]
MINPEEIYRLARKPDPWAPLDWAWAELDGTFGNRYDDPESRYRVLYASSQRLGCYLETLARFRPDPTLATELNQIEGENDFYPLGQVPAEWFVARMLGTAAFRGEYADVCGNEWLSRLRSELGPRLLTQFGIHDLDQAVLQAGAPRKLTQMVSRAIFNAGLDGIRYPSKYGSAIENWALFEPFKIEVRRTDPIALDDTDLARALRLLRLAVA